MTDGGDLPDQVDLAGRGVELRGLLAGRWLRSFHATRLLETSGSLAITTNGQQALGEVLLNQATGSIGYIVGAAHRGQRLAVRALRAVTEYAHVNATLPRIILEIEPDNHPSIAVARSASSAPPTRLRLCARARGRQGPLGKRPGQDRRGAGVRGTPAQCLHALRLPTQRSTVPRTTWRTRAGRSRLA
ncbi:GNAT family N-acetyltransferase [Streptomyces canus]|uniref:GNAT family N-acetyltransferase n=1 Tax=Streptomyces canus TaxID=58343 RepID=UPI0033A3E6C7